MHEMGIAMEIMNIAYDSIPKDIENPRIQIINLKIGKLAAVVPESLSFCFNIITKDSPFAEAKLNIEEIPVKARCKDCNVEWIIEGPVFVCEKCNSGSIEILSGRELDIESIEIEEKE